MGLVPMPYQRGHEGRAVLGEIQHLTMAVISGGCTKYLQAPNVVWNGPFKVQLRDYYDNWMAGDKVKTYNKSENLRAPSRRLLVDWVLGAWDALDRESLINSFKVCGLTVAADGSEYQLIYCLKEGQPCQPGREMLLRARQQGDAVVQEEEASDEEQQFLNELVIEEEDDDEGGEGEEGEEEEEEEGEEEEDDEWV
ncbi:uncharacterized protein LOC133549687 isoform X2 [Nerophis ophidion]|uniref:uncharacterized protein LOC133549687 isoform X2 n=1 Tax=Nerophis ophidion TaxID=159077 RepID=UPI002AE063C7|nr:uncharacterized protein LOC133549687 isoform X2 [Nerophis ophidion]